MKLIPDNTNNDPEFNGSFPAKNSDASENVLPFDTNAKDNELEDEEMKIKLERLRAWFSIHL